MAGISKVILIGNLGRDPETRYTPSGAMNVQFTMAVSRRFRDNAGQDQERTNWFRVTAWAKLAETLDNLTQQGYLAKGKQVYVEGRLKPANTPIRTGRPVRRSMSTQPSSSYLVSVATATADLVVVVRAVAVRAATAATGEEPVWHPERLRRRSVLTEFDRV